MILVSKVNFRYERDSKLVLNNCTASFFSPGKFLIVGENASGKSTIMDLISGFKAPVVGSVKINNVDLYSSTKSIEKLRRIISYMPSSLILPFNLEVSFLLKTWSGSYFKEQIIKDLDLDVFLDFQYRKLSDGYRNRLHMAITLSRGTYVLMDEPLKSQDDDLKKIFPSLLDKYLKGRTLIVSSPNYIDNVKWDAVFKMQGGQLIENPA
jgi:ABC-type multidrug transport system ATPase subunit